MSGLGHLFGKGAPGGIGSEEFGNKTVPSSVQSGLKNIPKENLGSIRSCESAPASMHLGPISNELWPFDLNVSGRHPNPLGTRSSTFGFRRWFQFDLACFKLFGL